MTVAFAESNGVSIHYEITGDAGLPTLVLSHALGANLAMWEPQAAALASHFRLLRYDTRGHGASTLPPEPFSIADLGQDVLNLLDTLQIARASFCGISMGGLIGQWLGIHAPGRLQKLILSNTAAKIGTEDGWNTRMAAVLRDGLPSIIPGALERWFTAGFRAAHPAAVAAIGAMLQSTDAKGYIANCAAIRDADFRAALQAIQAPTLVIAGSYDQGTTPADGQFLAENIAGSAYVELSAAHLSSVEAASEFNAALLDFLQR
jgi:3-oxoadipate enol-lactonase